MKFCTTILNKKKEGGRGGTKVHYHREFKGQKGERKITKKSSWYLKKYEKKEKKRRSKEDIG